MCNFCLDSIKFLAPPLDGVKCCKYVSEYQIVSLSFLATIGYFGASTMLLDSSSSGEAYLAPLLQIEGVSSHSGIRHVPV